MTGHFGKWHLGTLTTGQRIQPRKVQEVLAHFVVENEVFMKVVFKSLDSWSGLRR